MMNRIFIFSNEADQQPVFIDLALLATGELFIKDNIISMQFTEGLEGITVEFTTSKKASSELLRVTTALTDFHDEVSGLTEYIFLDDGRELDD